MTQGRRRIAAGPPDPNRKGGRFFAGAQRHRLPAGADRRGTPSSPAETRGEERLQKVLARAGIASRRRCEELIAAGRVRVNGRLVLTPGTCVDAARDRIQVDGETVRAERPLTIMLHKPAGYITSRSDPQGRPVVTSLVEGPDLPRLFPVGRLDWDSEGLLLLTNDGELANILTHPRYGVRKVYHAKLKGHPDADSLACLTHGVLCNGERLTATAAEMHHSTRLNSWITISIDQGRYRQVRRMCEAIGHPVLRLVRVALGPLQLGSLPRGHWRPLTPAELRSLQGLVSQRP